MYVIRLLKFNNNVQSADCFQIWRS